jgi:hypothetical protein
LANRMPAIKASETQSKGIWRLYDKTIHESDRFSLKPYLFGPGT